MAAIGAATYLWLAGKGPPKNEAVGLKVQVAPSGGFVGYAGRF